MAKVDGKIKQKCPLTTHAYIVEENRLKKVTNVVVSQKETYFVFKDVQTLYAHQVSAILISS